MVSSYEGAYPHLTRHSSMIAERGDQERITYLRTGVFIGYGQAKTVLDRVQELVDWPRQTRMPNVLVVGDSGAGKTSILRQIGRRNPAVHTPDRELFPVVQMEMPPGANLLRFYGAILKRMGMPPNARRRVSEAEYLVELLLRESKVRLLLIDEVHNLNGREPRETRDVLTALRYLGNELEIPIVAAGTSAARALIRNDPQLESRFEPIELRPWRPDHECKKLLASFAAFYPLRRPSMLATTDMTEYLLTRSEGALGELVKLLRMAAEYAIRSGAEAITPEVLSSTPYVPPREQPWRAQRGISI